MIISSHAVSKLHRLHDMYKRGRRYNEIVYKHRKSIMKLPFLSIPLFSIFRISSWVELTRFVTDFDFFFFKRTIVLSIIINYSNFGTNVSRRLKFITACMTLEPRHYVRLDNHRAQPRFDIIRWRHFVYRWAGGFSSDWVQRLSTQVNFADWRKS